jgi:hypothetical protein
MMGLGTMAWWQRHLARLALLSKLVLHMSSLHSVDHSWFITKEQVPFTHTPVL